jgi:hypothetical protein
VAHSPLEAGAEAAEVAEPLWRWTSAEQQVL